MKPRKKPAGAAADLGSRPSESAALDNTNGREDQVEAGVQEDAASPSPDAKPKRRWKKPAIVAVVIILLVAGVAFTGLKYAILGVFLKGQAEVTVVDSKTDKPIENATVSLGQVSAKSDKSGKAKLIKLKLGNQPLKVTKKGYRDYTDTVSVFLGQQAFGPVKFIAVGVPIAFKVTDAVGQLPLGGVSVTVNSTSDETAEDGTVTLNLDPGTKASAEIKKAGYTTQTVDVPLAGDLPPTEVKLVPDAKNYFLSNRSGRIDMYQSNVDGTAQTIVLAGTGKESNATSLLVSDTGRYIALLSSRDGLRDNQGNLINVLYIFDTTTKVLTKVSSSSNLSLIGWIDNYVVYTSSYNNGSQTQSRLFSYNAAPKQEATLAITSYFASTQILNSRVFYAVNDNSQAEFGLYAINPDGSDKRHVYDQSSTFTRTSRDVITIAGYRNNQNEWLTYDASNSHLEHLAGQPPQVEDRYLELSDSGSRGALVLERDGRRELYLTDAKGSGEKKITTVGSVRFVERWLGDDYVIFRVQNSDQTADYIVNIYGGPAAKITDVFSGGSYYGY